MVPVTSALLDVLYACARSKTAITYQDLLLRLRQSLQSSGLDQVPQLTSSRPLELQRTPFQLAAPGASASGGVSRALLVGINYRGQYGQLNGCHNDVQNVKKYLMTVHGFQERNIEVLTDAGGSHPHPTRYRIIAALKRLAEQSRTGDSVYFHYSGHGGLLSPDFNAFKSNRKEYDETLYPVDHERSGQIRDFSLFNNFVRPLRAGVRATCNGLLPLWVGVGPAVLVPPHRCWTDPYATQHGRFVEFGLSVRPGGWYAPARSVRWSWDLHK